MENQLKSVKAVIQETIFKDFQFEEQNRKNVHLLIKSNKAKTKTDNWKQRTKHRLQGILVTIAYCAMLIVISSIIIHYVESPSENMANIPAKNVYPKQGDLAEKDNPKPQSGNVLTKSIYKNETYFFQLSIPESWLNVVQVEELEYGVRFFYTGSDGVQQDLVTIVTQKKSERLKFIYEGGPDPSTDIALLGELVYRYYTPLDLALTNDENIQEYGKLNQEIKTAIKSFNFIDQHNGFIGETPYIYGFSPQFMALYGFEVNTPDKWQNLFKIEESETEMKFLFNKPGAQSEEVFSILILNENEWNNLKTNINEEKVYREITTKDGKVFIATIVKENPYIEEEYFYPFEMLRNEAELVLETFQFLE
jgi:hypothetical protein